MRTSIPDDVEFSLVKWLKSKSESIEELASEAEKSRSRYGIHRIDSTSSPDVRLSFEKAQVAEPQLREAQGKKPSFDFGELMKNLK